MLLVIGGYGNSFLEFAGQGKKVDLVALTKVINPAIKEIRTKASVDVTWKSIAGKGRKIERLEFRFPVEQQKTIQVPKSKPLATA